MAITFDRETKTFFLDGKNVTYAFYINEIGYPVHLYYGAAIGHDSLLYTCASGTCSFHATPPEFDDPTCWKYSYGDYPPELAFFGTSDYREPCVTVQNEAGDFLTELLYTGHTVLESKPPIGGMPSLSGGETLVLHLSDYASDFAADLYYTVYEDADVVARRIVYRNHGRKTVVLRRAYSFSLGLPRGDYEVMSLYGGWARERQIDRVPMHHGVYSIDSKRGSSSAVLNPFIGILTPGATERSGEVYGISLVYSSSFVLKVQGLMSGETLVTGGINDFNFSWKLDAGESFETPEIVLAFSDEGIGGMSRTLHDAYRNHLINPRYVYASRPIVINNWEATYFDFSNEKLMGIVDAVAGTGIDTFVLDDGWFGTRNSSMCALGDWFVNEQKLEGGIDTIIDYVHDKGMRFGLWFEPEMISEDSDLYRAHPDYAIRVPDRKPSHSRHQLVLDLTRPEVRDSVVTAVNGMLHAHRIEYVKWDSNRNLTEFYSPSLPADRQGEFTHRWVLGFYDLCERIIEANPDVFFEGCSGGGARFDPAMLHYFPQIWCSDDSDANERVAIQYGTSVPYPLSAASCHVSICPNHQTGRTTPFSTRAVIAGLGATGYELDTTTFTEEDRAAVRAQVAEYRACEELILRGDLYRIDDPTDGNFCSEAIVSKDRSRAVLVCYRRMGGVNNEIKRVRMEGLAPGRRYRVPELGLTLTGATLMHVGIVPDYTQGDFATAKYHFEAID